MEQNGSFGTFQLQRIYQIYIYFFHALRLFLLHMKQFENARFAYIITYGKYNGPWLTHNCNIDRVTIKPGFIACQQNDTDHTAILRILICTFVIHYFDKYNS